VVSYTAIGFILGLVGMIIGGGTSIGIPYMFQGILKILAGLMMVIMGINMLGIIPGLRRFTIRPPKEITRLIGSKRKNAAGPFAVGLLNGLMPCGPLQSMWIVALASADPFKGALSMLLFSLGTVPLMLGFGSFATMLSKKFSRQVMKAGAVLVVVLGLSMISQGGALSGINLSARGTEQIVSAQENSPEIAQNPTTEEIEKADAGSSADTEVQEIYSTISAGYYPNITVKAGVPVRWVINAPEGSLTGCNYRMIIPAYGIEHTFDYGENVIEFTPDKSGVVGYSCWMGMIRAQIYVEENE
ncbi:MAG: sulfite exporter TauE/SafE family protein, partial [Lachnospiraceae bacterium]|nr:sulfite exporter TauE/SafE family protein [Lachnospiraceae bacterium]